MLRQQPGQILAKKTPLPKKRGVFKDSNADARVSIFLSASR